MATVNKHPVVAIVGRPNVGKSTLFNRIIQRREAIVDDQPGITRDRKSAQAEWEDKTFTVIDTGGYIPKTRDEIEAGVTQQVKYAIQESDYILFVVDCTTGITDVDLEVAELLRKHQKPSLLVVNKSDNEQRDWQASEFYSLGLDIPVPVSALASRGIGDLLSMIIEHLIRSNLILEDGNPDENEEDVLHLAIVGKPNVGKSTFINTMLGEERLLVTNIPGTTRDAVDVQFQYKKQKVLLIDTAGMRKRTKITDSVEYYSNLRTHSIVEKCELACVFVDASEGVTQQDMRVIREVVEARKGIVLVVNKWDLLIDDAEQKAKFWEDLEIRLQAYAFVPVVSISCKTGLRVEKVMNQVMQVYRERNKRISSSEMNTLLTKLNQQYRHPAVRGKNIRVKYATQIKSSPPMFVFFSNYPDLIKPEYKRYLENHIRDQFGFRGVPIHMVFRKK